MKIQGLTSICIEYPHDWTDKYKDRCYHYEFLNGVRQEQ